MHVSLFLDNPFIIFKFDSVIRYFYVGLTQSESRFIWESQNVPDRFDIINPVIRFLLSLQLKSSNYVQFTYP